ncbi:MAG: S9 family peptidase [Acidimicrobiia bacterium]|nr:S9 family peptidase [Acidimicrobiia bacterium]
MAPTPAPPRVTAALCAWGRTVAEPRLAPGGERVAFVATAGGRGQLVVVDLDAGGGGLHAGPELVVSSTPPPCSARAYGGGTFDWLRDGSGLVYAAVDGGLWLQPVDGAPPRRLVEHGPASSPAVSPDGTRVAYVVDTRHVAVVPLGVDGAWPVRLSTTADFCLDPAWSSDGRQVVWQEWDVPAMPWDASRIVARAADGSGGVEVVAGGDTAVQQPRFAATGALAYLGDQSGWGNVRTAGAGVDRALREEDCEHGGPSWGPGQRSFAWSPDGNGMAVCRNEGGFGSLGLVDISSGALRELARGVHGGLSWQGNRLAAVRSGARTPTQVVVYHGEDLATRLVVAQGPPAGFQSAGLVEPQGVSWPGDDGVEIPGRLYRPTTVADEPPPLIAWVHGGPTGQMEVVFNARIAYWVDRGWAVLVPDHRGSTGHGRAFTQALAGRWGELDVADVAAGLRAAADREWGHRRRLVAMGGSAGGFTVLNLLATSPECCAAGVDLYGVADLFELDETTHRFEAHYLHSLLGPLPETAEAYRDRSPVNRLDAITAPLLILQGDKDGVVPLAQSQAVADGLRQRGRTVELHVYEGEGHGWGRPETLIDELERTEAFLTRHVLRRRTP